MHDVTNKFFFAFYYIKQVDSMLPCICSVIDHRDVKMCQEDQ